MVATEDIVNSMAKDADGATIGLSFVRLGAFFVGFLVWALGVNAFFGDGPIAVAIAAVLVGGVVMQGVGYGWFVPGRLPVAVAVAVSAGLLLIALGIGDDDVSVVQTVSLSLGITIVLAGFGTGAVRAVAAEDRLAARAVLDARRQIAREVHDLVGHSLSVTMLHLNIARMALDSDVEAARGALENAEQHGRNNMEEIRNVVRLLKSDDASRSDVLPGISDIDRLIESYDTAGVEIDVDSSLEPDSVPAVTGLVVYRVFQEGLTNAVRHGRGEISVVARPTDEVIEVVIENRMARARRAGRSTGVGLVGMRERVETLGGSFSAGPSESGGRWRVHARIPA